MNWTTWNKQLHWLTTKNVGGSVARHQESSFEENGQRNQKYNSLRQKMPMIWIPIVLSGRYQLGQFCIVFTAFFELFTRLLTTSRHWNQTLKLKWILNRRFDYDCVVVEYGSSTYHRWCWHELSAMLALLLVPMHQSPLRWLEFPTNKKKVCVTWNLTSNWMMLNVANVWKLFCNRRKLLTSLSSCSLFNWSWNCVNNSFGKPVILSWIRGRFSVLDADEMEKDECYDQNVKSKCRTLFCLFVSIFGRCPLNEDFRQVVRVKEFYPNAMNQEIIYSSI